MIVFDHSGTRVRTFRTRKTACSYADWLILIHAQPIRNAKVPRRMRRDVQNHFHGQMPVLSAMDKAMWAVQSLSACRPSARACGAHRRGAETGASGGSEVDRSRPWPENQACTPKAFMPALTVVLVMTGLTSGARLFLLPAHTP